MPPSFARTECQHPLPPPHAVCLAPPAARRAHRRRRPALQRLLQNADTAADRPEAVSTSALVLTPTRCALPRNPKLTYQPGCFA